MLSSIKNNARCIQLKNTSVLRDYGFFKDNLLFNTFMDLLSLGQN